MRNFNNIPQLVLGGVLVLAMSLSIGCGGGGGGYGGGGGSVNNPPPPVPSPSPTTPTVHLNFFGTANGVKVDPKFGAVSGFTQQLHAQVLGLAPGTQVMIKNNDAVTHTINVMSAFPTPGPQSTASVPNGGVFGVGFQSGPLAPGATMGPLTVTGTAGDLFIICGIHFVDGMKDGAVIAVGATPGPEATPAPAPSGGCHGYGC